MTDRMHDDAIRMGFVFVSRDVASLPAGDRQFAMPLVGDSSHQRMPSQDREGFVDQVTRRQCGLNFGLDQEVREPIEILDRASRVGDVRHGGSSPGFRNPNGFWLARILSGNLVAEVAHDVVVRIQNPVFSYSALDLRAESRNASRFSSRSTFSEIAWTMYA